MLKYVCALAALCALVLSLSAPSPAEAVEPQFTFAVIGDRTSSAEEGEYEKVLAEAAQLGPDFLVTVGDHIQGYAADSAEVERQWDEFLGLMEGTGIPYHLTPGNHDIWDRRSETIFRKHFGAPDSYFRFMGKVFVILDVSTLNSADEISETKLQWLKGVLEVSKKSGGIYVFYHKPFWAEDFSARKADLLHDLFRSYPVKAVFTGHYHRYFHTVRDSIEYFGVSSSGASVPAGGEQKGAIYGYLLARVKGDSLSVRLLEPGIFTPTDLVSYDDAIAMADAERRSVRLNELVAYDFSMSGAAQVTVNVENVSGTTLMDTASWVLRGDWAVQPMNDYIEVPPGETGTLTAFVRCDGSLFPVPILEMRVPCCGSRTLAVAKPLNVKRMIFADFAGGHPVIDGDLSEDDWQESSGETRFFGPQGGTTAADSTVLRVCYDSTNIYIAVECFDGQIASLAASATERDAFVADDDAVTLLFEPLRDSGVFYQISLNPLGTVFDRRIDICPFGTYVPDSRWDAPVEAAALVGPDRWQVEAAIPVSALDPNGLGSPSWGFNFMRIQQRRATAADFQAPFRYRSDSIGLLGFR